MTVQVGINGFGRIGRQVYKAIYENYQGILDVEAVSYTHLDVYKRQDMNSIAVILAHTAGAWRYWVGDVAGDLPSGRVRAEEFETFKVDAAEMLGRLSKALDTTRQVLGQLAPPRLGEARTAGMFNEERTVGWALLHVLEHTALHACLLYTSRCV